MTSAPQPNSTKINFAKMICIPIILLALIVSIILFVEININAKKVRLSKTSYQQLPGWKQDNQTNALLAFRKSCDAILKSHANQKLYRNIKYAGTNDAWHKVCIAAQSIKPVNQTTARKFFVDHFQPYTVSKNGNTEGLFTGYYAPIMRGSLTKTKRFQVPLYAKPKDLVAINLNLFDKKLPKKTIVGQVKKGYLIPYPNRKLINDGYIHQNTAVIVWLENRIERFFLQIQGSGEIILPNGKRLSVGYAGKNGRPYSSIGKQLIREQALTKPNVSMQSIRQWLLKHPKKGHELMDANQSFVFFKVLKSKKPIGAQGVPLTAERSLAVDKTVIPLGAPIWLDTTAPITRHKKIAFRHLLIAQDTGGAIKGAVRGDIFWGSGNKAKHIAGHMKQPGRYWVLLPKAG